MATDYSVHQLGLMVQGEGAPAPEVPALAGEQALADDTDSAAIVLSAPGVIAVQSDAKVRVEIRPSGDAQDVANSVLWANADELRYFTVRGGSWKLRVTAYV